MASVFLFSFIITVLIGYLYPHIAIRCGLIANPNFRSLHERPIPRGGGIAVACITSFLIAFLYHHALISLQLFLVLFPCGLIVTLFGLCDDRYEISARYRLLFQCLVALWTSFMLGLEPPLNLGFTVLSSSWLELPLGFAAIVWFFNLYNFIDGTDGMALSATIFISLSMSMFLFLHHDKQLALISFTLCVTSSALILFNWPPAKLFIGETGSSFCAFIICSVILASLWKHQSIFWIWLIVLGFYICDTTSTTVTRIIKYPRSWYKPHRSHAYQNLARQWNSHLKVILLVLAIDIFWLLPLATIAFLNPKLAWLITTIAYIPIILFCLRFGPLNEDV